MSDKKPRYITTTLPYVNADPHIGFALEIIQADTLARYWRLIGHEVFFNTGTDEHGQKIARQIDPGRSIQEYVDHYAGEFAKLKEALNLSYDHFIRTTDTGHKTAAQEIWKRCAERGDIYKKKYSGLYCVGCEVFYKEDELDENKCCKIHGKPVQEVEEENYFFKLSNYQSYLEEYLAEPGVIEPEWRRQEALSFVQAGLEDFSISREKARLSWGIPVPDDESQVMYVWFDALTNYISTLGWPEEGGNFTKFWTEGETLQLAGKDQVRFQSIMWQAMLKSAGVKATDKVVYHGFITSGGQKMSKSLGNVISPYELVARYGTDATRYLLLRHVHPFDDSDVTWEKLDEWYTANLVNGLGNLVSRVMKMCEAYKEQFPEYKIKFDFEMVESSSLWEVTKQHPVLCQNLNTFRFDEAVLSIWNEVGKLDSEIQEKQPFKKIKEDPITAIDDVVSMVRDVERIAILLTPIMPTTAAKILAAIKENKKPDNLFPRLEI